MGLLLLLTACDAAPAVDSAPPEPLPVRSFVVEKQAGFRMRESYAGRIVSRRSSELGFERGGRLEQIDVDEADRVEAGQVLAALESRQLEARRRELAAQLREIDSRLTLARLTRERRRGLIERDSISAQRYDEAVHSERALASQLEAARAALEGVAIQLELSRITAPYAGTVTARLADEGTVVAPGQTILRLIETEALEFRVGVPPEAAQQLTPGQEHAVEVGGQRFAARLDALVPSVAPDTRTLTAVFRLESADSLPGHGSLGHIRLESEIPASGFWLPISALTESRRGLWSSFVLAEDGEGDATARLERRELQVLHSESDRAFVRGTLRDGERIVPDGLHRLVPGQRVRVLP